METQNYTNLTKEIKDKYKQLKQLLKEEGITEEVFTDKFLELSVEISDKLSFLLGEKSETTKARKEESLENLYQRTIAQAINRIIEIQDTPEIELDYSLFKPGEKLKGVEKGEEEIKVKKAQKYNQFLRVYYELFLGRKDVTKEVFIEKLDDNKMRKIPYRIIYVKGPDFSRTILISDQIGEASFVYDGLVDKKSFENIEKGEEIDGKETNRIIYGLKYGEKLKEQLQVDFKVLEREKITDKQILEEENRTFSRDFIIDLWKNGELGDDFINTHKIKQYSDNWNRKNAEKKEFSLPISISKLISILGGNKEENGNSQEYIKCLLEGREFVKTNLITEKKLKDLWEAGELGEDLIDWQRIKKYSEDWNEKNAKDKGFRLPISVEGMISILGGNKRKNGISKKYVKSLLEGKEFKKIRLITKEELKDLWKAGELGEDFVKALKLKKYSKNWNEKNAEDKGYKLPISIDGLLSILGGNKGKNGISRKYIESLLEGKEYKLEELKKINVITKQELQTLWKAGELGEDFLKSSRIKRVTEEWNEKNAEDKGFKLPISIDGIISVLGGDCKVYGRSGKYIKSLLEGKEFKLVRFIKKQELKDLLKKGEIGEDIKNRQRINKYSKNWNKKNTERLGFRLPLSINGLVRILGGDIKKYGTGQKYVESLLEGK